MPIDNIDLTTNSSYSLSPMILTDTLKTLFGNIIDNIQVRRAKLTTLQQETESELNSVIGSINVLRDGATIDLDALQSTIQGIIDLESENGDETFVSQMQTMYTELNRREEADRFRIKVLNAPNGKFDVDLTAYNFQTMEEYQVICKVPTQVDGKLITATFKKVSKTKGVVTLRDKDVFQSASISTSFYDPNGTELDVVFMLVRTSTKLSGTTTEVDGDVDNYGELPIVYPEALAITDASLVFDKSVGKMHLHATLNSHDNVFSDLTVSSTGIMNNSQVANDLLSVIDTYVYATESTIKGKNKLDGVYQQEDEAIEVVQLSQLQDVPTVSVTAFDGYDSTFKKTINGGFNDNIVKYSVTTNSGTNLGTVSSNGSKSIGFRPTNETYTFSIGGKGISSPSVITTSVPYSVSVEGSVWGEISGSSINLIIDVPNNATVCVTKVDDYGYGDSPTITKEVFNNSVGTLDLSGRYSTHSQGSTTFVVTVYDESSSTYYKHNPLVLDM